MRFLGHEAITRPRYGHWLLGLIPDKWLYRFPPFHCNWYDRFAFGLETEIAVSQIFSRGSLYHFLYGEHSCRLAGKVNRQTGHRSRVVATYHQLPSFFEARRAQFEHLRDLDGAILVASNQREFFEGFLESQRVFVIPHGVDTRFFCNGKERDKSPTVFRCLTVGSNYRDLDTHLQVISNLRRSMSQQIEFWIVGDADSAQAYEPTAGVRHFYGISDKELKELYQAADLLLLPLKDATACNALLEGMSSGLPIVVTDVGGVRDYVDDECAVLVPSGDVTAMTNAVVELVDDPDRRAGLGGAARRRAEIRLDWQIISERMQEAYRQLA